MSWRHTAHPAADRQPGLSTGARCVTHDAWVSAAAHLCKEKHMIIS